jgi:hypothetical protein
MADLFALTRDPSRALRARRATVTIEAERTLSVSPVAIHAVLADLPSHTGLTGDKLRLREITAGGRGGRVTLSGPLGIHRTATTQATTSAPQSASAGLPPLVRRRGHGSTGSSSPT